MMIYFIFYVILNKKNKKLDSLNALENDVIPDENEAFLAILVKLQVFKPFIYGRRAPDHRIKFGGITKHYS